MPYRFNSLVLGLLLSTSVFHLNAQNFGLTIDSVEAAVNQTVCIPVRVNMDIEIFTLYFKIKWDPQALNYTNLKNLHLPGWSWNDFNTIQPGQLIGGWANPAGECSGKDSADILFEICFVTIGPPGTNALITVDTGEAGICSGIFGLVPIGKDTGTITITTLSGTAIPQNPAERFQISPNPTAADANIVFQSEKSGVYWIVITDLLGRTVLEEKIPVTAGENRFEIPAKVLNAKGMYQVSLQTEQGGSSQMLSVN